jgi:hypothetical protein
VQQGGEKSCVREGGGGSRVCVRERDSARGILQRAPLEGVRAGLLSAGGGGCESRVWDVNAVVVASFEHNKREKATFRITMILK